MNDKNKILISAVMFEFYVRYIWPLHRHFARRRLARRCTQCAASEKMISIQADGICDLCHRYHQAGSASAPRMPDKGEERALYDLVASYPGRGRGQYDALVLFSGGKDSIYMIRRLQTEHPGLRLLAYTLDNGFMSPVAKENIDAVLPKLNVDHVFIRPRASFYIRLFGYGLQHLNDQGGYGTVDFSDGEFMLDTARRLAYEQGIPLIFCGYSRYQVQNGLGIHHFEAPPEHERTTRTETAGLKIDDIFDDPVDRAAWWRGGNISPEHVARLLFPLYAWDLEENQIIEHVRSWGLMSRKNVSPIVTNHQMIPLIGVVDVHKFGYSSFEPEFCRMIREGRADRRHWQHTFEFLEYTSRTGLFLKQPVNDLLKKLGLSAQDVGIRF